MPQGKTNMGGAAAGLGAAVVLAACFMSADHKRGLTCDEAAERGYICEPGAGVAGGGGSVSGTAGAPVMGAGGASGLGGGGAGGGGSGSGGSAGGGPVCTAPEVDCGGTCVDLTASDAANCGACGRSCLGTATCAAGACVPEAMATNEVAPYALVHDEASLYWVSPAVKTDVGFRSRVRRVAKAGAGGAAESLFGSTEVRARSLGFDGTKLYWGDLGASPSDGNQNLFAGTPGEVVTQLVEPSQLGVQHLRLGVDKAYWTLTGSSALRGKLLTASAGQLDPNVFDQTNPSWLTIDADAVPYWVALAGALREVRRTVSPSTAEPVAAGPDVVAVELTADRYYWADRGAGTVQSRPKATPTEAPRDEFSGQGAVEGFGLEASSGVVTLYVLTTEGRQLKAWRKGPEDKTPLLLGEVTAKADPYGGNPFGAAYVLTDAQYLYFADVGTVDTTPDVDISEGDGVVYRVAR